jgi:hypothetical protein
MSHDNTTKDTGESQDALRHQQDALHHKVPKSPLPGKKEAIENDANQQPEVPKVGSRDAPGG